MSALFAATPQPPYYAAIFTSLRTQTDQGYGEMAERMVELAGQQAGYLGAESTRDAEGFGITVSYWESEEAIRQWKHNAEHQIAQEKATPPGTSISSCALPRWSVPTARPADRNPLIH
jgi:heme-degrading monooxygenase HmoA